MPARKPVEAPVSPLEPALEQRVAEHMKTVQRLTQALSEAQQRKEALKKEFNETDEVIEDLKVRIRAEVLGHNPLYPSGTLTKVVFDI